MKVNVKDKTLSIFLPVVVVKGNGLALFGRDWMKVIKLDWKAIHFVTDDSNKYSVIDNSLGCIKGIKATLIVKEGVKSKLFK